MAQDRRSAAPRPWRLTGLAAWRLPDPTLRRLQAATVLSCLVAWLLKARVVGLVPRFRIPISGVTDIHTLFAPRAFTGPELPYVTRFNEYPPLTGLLQWLLGRGGPSEAEYFARTALVLAALAMVTTWLLWRWRPGDRRLWLWALSPAVALYTLHNWDMLPVALSMAGLLLFARERYAWSGLLLGLGATAKWYPALFLVVLGVALLRKEHGLRTNGWTFGLAGVGAIAAIHVPLLLANADQVVATYRFHAERVANQETPWWVVSSFIDRMGGTDAADAIHGSVDWVLPLAFAVGTAWTLWRVARGKLDWLPGCFAILLVFMLTSKVFSIQYALWLAPLLVLLPVPSARIAQFWIADVWVNIAIIGYLTLVENEGIVGVAPEPWMYAKLAAGVAARTAVMAMMLAWVWTGRGSGTKRDASPAAGAEPGI